MYIWYSIERFMNYVMKSIMNISLYHSLEYKVLIIDSRHCICFYIPDHELMSHTVAIMKEHRCCHFRVRTVHVMNTFGHRGKSSLRRVFPKIFLIILLKNGIQTLVWFVVCLHELRYVNIQEIWVYFRTLGLVSSGLKYIVHIFPCTFSNAWLEHADVV